MKIAFRRTRPDKTVASKDKLKTKTQRAKEAGQIIAIFALALTALIGLVGIAVDVTFAWREELRIQRAADAAALAGVVYLPGDVSGGLTASANEAHKNGYTGGVNNTSVVASQDPVNDRQMDVSITTRVPTFFMRIFGVDHFTVSRSSKAVYILPVPMGSPNPYYGIPKTYLMKSGSSDTTITMKGPNSESVSEPQGFWATMLTQGAGAASGDAYMPKKLDANQTSMSPPNPMHDTVNYYDYGIYMPPGVSGNVYIFDPVFCATDNQHGAGDYYLDPGGTGVTPVSSYFKLYNTNNQPYDLAAHTPVAGANSGSLFANNKYSDAAANAPSNVTSSTTSCTGPASNYPTSDPRHYHNAWYKLTSSSISGGTDGATYRLRTTTDPGDSSQDSANAYNNFSIWATGTGAQVYGLGAMEMFTPLPGGVSSEFYLAKVDAQAGAGKTIQIRLWDVGDTYLDSSLQILQPTDKAVKWEPVNMTWTTTKVTSAPGPCAAGSGQVITTYSSGTKRYEGCWLTINVVLDSTYSAPRDGWWKVRYNMLGSSTSHASDLTTWQVNIRGNPVHLIP